MPHFFLHVFNGHGETHDEEGLDLEDQAAARQMALDSIRSMISEDARSGSIDLTGYIAIKDASDSFLLRVDFAEAFDLHLPGGQDQGQT
jgi:hypothetical protein